MPASCPDHGLTAEAHCEEIEKMLEEVPGNFCEGEGDSPRDAVKRLRLAYEEAVEQRDDNLALLARGVELFGEEAPQRDVSDGRMIQRLKAHDEAARAMPSATLAEEAATTIVYLTRIIDHEIPVPDESDPGEAQGQAYLARAMREAKELVSRLRATPFASATTPEKKA